MGVWDGLYCRDVMGSMRSLCVFLCDFIGFPSSGGPFIDGYL